MSELYDAIVHENKKNAKTLLQLYSGKTVNSYKSNNIYKLLLDKNYYVLANIISSLGFTVLDKKAYQIYSLIDNKKSITDIYQLLLYTNKYSLESVVKTIDLLRLRELVWINKPISGSIKRYGSENKLTVWLHLTNNCNLRCDYCFVNKSTENMSDKMIETVIDKIFISAATRNIQEVAIGIAGGEPLLQSNKLRKLFNYAIDKSRDTGIKFSPGIATNGILITNKVAQLLKEYNVYVKLSLDGIGLYNDINRHFQNGKGSFEYIQKGIRNLQNNNVNWGVNIVVTEKSVNGLPQFVKWLLNNKILFNISFYRDNPASPKKEDLLSEHFVSQVKKAYSIIEQKLPSHPIYDFILDRTTFSSPHKRCCGIGLNYLVVNQKGQILSCPLFDSKIIGSIVSDDPISTMVQKCIVPKTVDVDTIKDCQTCIWRYYCAGGCPLLTQYNYEKYDSPTPICDLIKILAPIVVRLEGKRILKYNVRQNLVLYDHLVN